MRAARQKHAEEQKDFSKPLERGSDLTFPRDTYPMPDDDFVVVHNQNAVHKQSSNVYTDQEFQQMHRKNSWGNLDNDVPWHLYS